MLFTVFSLIWLSIPFPVYYYDMNARGILVVCGNHATKPALYFCNP